MFYMRWKIPFMHELRNDIKTLDEPISSKRTERRAKKNDKGVRTAESNAYEKGEQTFSVIITGMRWRCCNNLSI